MTNQNPELKALLEQKVALDDQITALSQDPNHPVRKPPHNFSEGEEVLALIEGQQTPGKIIAVEGDGTRFRYKVAIAATVTFDENDLTKA